MESWRTWWWELSAAGRAQWSVIAAGEHLTVEQLRKLQHEGLLMAGQVSTTDAGRRVLVPTELRSLAREPLARGA